MSELINNQKQRTEKLYQFSQGIIKGKDGTKLIAEYRDILQQITPHDMIAMEEKQLRSGTSVAEIKGKIEKVMNVLYDNLRDYDWKKPLKGHPLYNFMQENRELENILKRAKEQLQERDYRSFRTSLNEITPIELHYQRKENILFPFLEKSWEHCLPLSVMWSIHDDIRMKFKDLQSKLAQNKDFTNEIFKLTGELFFLLYGMIFKEELVIYPVAMETLTAEDWRNIEQQSSDIGYSFIKPEKNKFADDDKTKLEKEGAAEVAINISREIFQSETGTLDHTELKAVLNILPIDITFIDADDRVKYFSSPKERIFPRSPAIIGRKVQKCHPPESVHIVEKILKNFKSGDKDEAIFHIFMKGKFIVIRYYAVRDENGTYIGTLEASQNVTAIRRLEGERRLLDWEE